MFNISSYIKYPNKLIEDLSIINNNYNRFFIELDDENTIKTIVKDIESEYIEGVIYLEYNGTILMDFTYWDIIDQLWAYLVNLVNDTLNNQEAEVYFPDQPIKLKLKNLSNNLVLFTIESTTTTQLTLPKNEFFEMLLESANEFFLKVQGYFGCKVDYSYELELINKLKNKLAQ
ncbi:hypothetical protein HZI73_00580 [Vallitalea pronyensis]|uniref:Uncharacterized protein n=1 Tax=Vallitalea pronyensis TaxID=1348613 RepID=A0A8J8SF47_9FIRM|nr:hypothetical protein [Vallitalea pronyensis]QUI20893.1 hypothetical protein HZI73_00580 [Vallitalea pronyensis]